VVIASRTLLMWLVYFTDWVNTFTFLLGMYLITDLPSTSLFGLQFQMREPKMCQVVCRTTDDEKQAKELKEKIEDEYRVNMYGYYK
jgi:hypothetical protein